MTSVPSEKTESQALTIPPEVEELYRGLEKTVTASVPSANMDHIRAAFEYAFRAHGDQKRKSGEPYIIHPLAAAEIVAELGLDEESIIAALLHDCIEDTGATHLEIANLFGNDVADIVEGVTKLTRVTYTSKEEEQMENFRKMLLAMASDIRVIIIKLADRLHNMRTLEYHTEKKQREKALETIKENRQTFLYSCVLRVGELWRVLPNDVPDKTSRTVKRSLSGQVKTYARYAVALFYTWEFFFAALALISLAVTSCKSRKKQSKETVPRRSIAAFGTTPLFWGVLLVLSVQIPHLFYWTNMRMRAPLEVFVPIVAILGIYMLKLLFFKQSAKTENIEKQ